MTPLRRSLLRSIAAIAAFPGLAFKAKAETAPAGPDRYAGDAWRSLTQTQWRERLSPEAFAVLRQEGTERPWSSPLNDERRPGTYVCAGCGLGLFRSAWKFESGTGWPSFFDVIKENIGTKPDYKLILPRTEYHCARCLGHQGHVFEDGPAPTGLRYCNNGVALRFLPA